MSRWNYARTWEVVAREAPDRVAIATREEHLTFAEFDRRANRLARVLVAHGVGHGDIVGISLANRAEYLETLFAAMKLGAPPANINYSYRSEEIAYLLGGCDAAALIFSVDTESEVLGALEQLEQQPRLLLAVGGDPASPLVQCYEQALAGVPDTPVPRDREPDGDDTFILYTGGTTGRPKGVVWRAEDFYVASWQSGRPGTDPPDPAGSMRAGKRALTMLPASPLVHATAFGFALVTLNGGGTVVLCDARPFEPVAIWSLVEKERVGNLGIVGDTFAGPLLDVLDAEPYRFDLSSLTALVSSGMRFSTENKRRFLERFPGLTIVDALGSSESATMTRSVVSSDSIESPAVFTPRPGLRVLGDDGRDLEPGSAQEGLIAVTGHIPLGYMNDPEATAKTFPVIDGVRYVVPGDRARVLADGRIELLGRGSSCINTGGEKVYPEEVEEVLHSHPDVVDTAVLGVSDDRWGEMVVALVVTSSPADISEDLRSLCRAHLARYKCPKHFFNVDAVDRTVAGKLDVPRLRERLGALI